MIPQKSANITWRHKMLKLNRFDAVVKIGGSLIWGDHLKECVEILTHESRSKKILIIPGGGETDNLIENYHTKNPLRGDVFHETTLLAQDQTGLLLANQSDKFVAVRMVGDADSIVRMNKIPILLPSSLSIALDIWRPTNRFSSDSLAAYYAHLLSIEELIVFKSRQPKTFNPSASDLDKDKGYVDEVFSDLVTELNIRCRFVSPDMKETAIAYLSGSTDAILSTFSK